MNEIDLYIEQILPLKSGVSKSTDSTWYVQEYVGVTSDRTPKKIMFSVFGADIDRFNIQPNKTYQLQLNIESKSFKRKDGSDFWITEVRATDAKEWAPVGQSAPQVSSTQVVDNRPAYQQPVAQPQYQEQQPIAPQQSDDLPF